VGPERCEEEPNLWPLSGIEPRLLGRLTVEQTEHFILYTILL